MDRTSPAVPATEGAYELSEGPLWDAAAGRLRWVDIVSGLVLEGELIGGRVRESGRIALDEMVGAVVPGPEGQLLVAGRERLWVLTAGGSRLTGPRVIGAGESRRLNDGATDPSGRFLVGTLSLGAPTEAEVLVRLEPDGSLRTIDDDLGLANGLAWSGDGTLLYTVDTERRTIFRRGYDPGGAVGPRRVHLDLTPFHPDGIAVDAEDHLWVALWGAGEVRRYSPGGSLRARLTVASPQVSSVAFAGEDLRTLVVTTAREELTNAQRAAFPDCGRLFTATGEVPGQPLVPWSGAAGFVAAGGD